MKQMKNNFKKMKQAIAVGWFWKQIQFFLGESFKGFLEEKVSPIAFILKIAN